MKNRTRIFLIVLIVILMAAVIAAFTYFTVKKYAHAEYSQLNSESIVTFNQISNEINIQHDGTFNSSGYNIMGTSYLPQNLDRTHKYYVKFYFIDRLNTTTNLALVFGNTIVNQNAIITNVSQIDYYRVYGSASQNYDITAFVSIIDLTRMFGVNNTPSLQECERTFTADYYTYNTGTIMYFGVGEFSYQQQLTYNFNTGTIYGYPQNITNTQVLYNDTNKLILTATSSENYSGYYLINFKTTVPENSVIKLNFNSYTMQSGSYAGIYYIGDEEQYITSVPTSTAFNRPFNFEFITDRELSGLYLIVDYYTSGTVMTCEDVYIEVTLPTDYAIQFQAQYDFGYQQAQEYYTNGYGYTEIWTQGYNSGKAAGLIEANGSFTAMDYVKSAFVTLGDILNIEVFPNFTLGAFFLLPLITSAIFFIIKISKGG